MQFMVLPFTSLKVCHLNSTSLFSYEPDGWIQPKSATERVSGCLLICDYIDVLHFTYDPGRLFHRPHASFQI